MDEPIARRAEHQEMRAGAPGEKLEQTVDTSGTEPGRQGGSCGCPGPASRGSQPAHALLRWVWDQDGLRKKVWGHVVRHRLAASQGLDVPSLNHRNTVAVHGFPANVQMVSISGFTDLQPLSQPPDSEARLTGHTHVLCPVHGASGCQALS